MITSENTSRNQIARGFKLVDWSDIPINFDIGGGKYDKASEWLAKHMVENLIYDPYNRSDEFNEQSLYHSQFSYSTTIFNVLNVIPELCERIELLHFAKRERTKYIFITVYEGDKTGIGKKTRDGWQNNMKLISYLPEIQTIYNSAYIQKNMIIIEL